MGIGILLVLGYGVFTKPVLFSLERSYAPLIVEKITPKIRDQIRYVVVLGAGTYPIRPYLKPHRSAGLPFTGLLRGFVYTGFCPGVNWS